ncbi:MAG: uracil-DNA glycosylase [Candidatus Colwellbacteria bacterium]|nr:uracil-DNA glycosylase [Candidatus Colwellbacteria bacterium]
MNKTGALENLKNEILKDDSLPLKESNLVFGEGSPDAEVMFIGEAPGYYEDREGRPFVGQAGKLLNKLIEEVGWRREQVYITNIVKRRPPQNRDPLPEEIKTYEPYLKTQIDIINPKIIATLGRFSMNYFLPYAKISKDQGQVFWSDSRLIYPLYHPAAALRSTAVLEELKKSFQKLPGLVKDFDSLLAERKIINPESSPAPESPKINQTKLF